MIMGAKAPFAINIHRSLRLFFIQKTQIMAEIDVTTVIKEYHKHNANNDDAFQSNSYIMLTPATQNMAE